LDIMLPDGILLEIIQNIRNLYPHTRVAIFTMQPAEVYSNAFKRYGVRYYISKGMSEDEITLLLKNFLNNERRVRVMSNDFAGNNPFSKMTTRELQVLHYLLNGQTSSEISQILNINKSAVSELKAKILSKSQSSNIKDLFELATTYNIG